MSREWLRTQCLALPHVTENVQWDNDLVFKVAGKMFAVTCLNPDSLYLTVKVQPEEFAELTEKPGIIPAPYLARAQWVSLENETALPRTEILRLLNQSYQLIFAKLTRKQRAELESGGAAATSS